MVSAPKASLRAAIGPRAEVSSRILARRFEPSSNSFCTLSFEFATCCERSFNCAAIWLSNCTTVPEPEVPVSVPDFSASESFWKRVAAS